MRTSDAGGPIRFNQVVWVMLLCPDTMNDGRPDNYARPPLILE